MKRRVAEIPVPVRVVPVCLTEFATFDCQFAICPAFTSTFCHRSHVSAVRPFASSRSAHSRSGWMSKTWSSMSSWRSRADR